MNNVGRGSFGIGQVQRAFFEALTTLKAKMVRVNQDGKEVNPEYYFVIAVVALTHRRILVRGHTTGLTTSGV